MPAVSRASVSLRQAGFTLIEVITVIAVLGVGMVALISLQAASYRSQTDNVDYQTGIQLLQKCAEQVIAVRRMKVSGYTAINSTACAGMGTAGFSDPVITISTPASPICATDTTCQLLAITIAKGSSTLGPVNLMLVQY